MALFLLGLVLFFAPHGFTAFFRGAREAVIGKLGAGPYRGLFSLTALAGLVLIVIGWRSADPSPLYVPPYWLRHVSHLLMIFAIILLVAAYAPAGKIAHAAKHPMLAGVKIWAFAHLLTNGEVRSVLLFGAFLVWAIADRIALKKRDAPIPAAGPWKNDIIAIAIGLAAYAAIAFYLHRYIAGVPVF